MNRIPVTPNFQSARLAGWKTGATKLHGFMAPIRVQYWKLKLSMNRQIRRQVLECDDAVREVTALVQQRSFEWVGR